MDGLRGLAILMVLGIHFLYLGAFPTTTPASSRIFHALQFGWMGVDLFFALSGFLITGILLDSRESPNFFSSFYARRALRIFPLYYVVIVFVFFGMPFLPKIPIFAYAAPDSSLRLSYFTYTDNWLLAVTNEKPGVIGDFWSLAIEEQFYLLWPFLVFKFNRKTFTWICISICLFSLLFRIPFAISTPASPIAFLTTTARMDALCWGALGAIVVRSPVFWKSFRTRLPWIGALSAAAILFIDFPLHEFYSRAQYTQTIGFSCIAIGCTALVLMVYHSDLRFGRLGRVFRLLPLRSFGRYSYGIYVLHGFVLTSLGSVVTKRAWFGQSLPAAVLLYIAFNAVCFLIAMLSFHALEEPFLKLKVLFVAQQPTLLAAATPIDT